MQRKSRSTNPSSTQRGNPTLRTRRKRSPNPSARSGQNRNGFSSLLLNLCKGKMLFASLMLIFLFTSGVYLGKNSDSSVSNPNSDAGVIDTDHLTYFKRQKDLSVLRRRAETFRKEHPTDTSGEKEEQPSKNKAGDDDDDQQQGYVAPNAENKENSDSDRENAHLYPRLPILPIFSKVSNDNEKVSMLINDTLFNDKPTIAGIAAILQNFVSEFHALNLELSSSVGLTSKKIVKDFMELIENHLVPLDKPYRHQKPVFPIREDDSVYMSLASFREHLLKQTMVGAIDNAKNPDKIFFGAIVQNCFGRVDKDDFTKIYTDNNPCKTGVEVVGKNKNGSPMTKVSNAPPDKNGVEEFCSDPNYKKYCDAGQVRVLYVHETESIGPAMARYYASKLWGGETYFVQTDSHLKFAKHWDEKYINEVKATKNYPKSVLSAYPPGWDGSDDGKPVNETPGARLCSCEFSTSSIEHQIIRINTGVGYHGNEPRPTQIPFIAAGFFFARAEFLVDVPFDPFLPWCFMGEEIALSVRAWTSGWDIYAPRKNLIVHQYRPGRLGLPKFWEGINRLYPGVGGNNEIQGKVIDRVRNLVKYPEATEEEVAKQDKSFVLTELDQYGLGTERTLEEYMKWTGINVQNKQCPSIKWCNQGTLD
jgi:[Skp1-protein]-hydroxyproline N-acetylglucosaminyltransferase